VIDEVAIGEKFRALAGELNERQRRLWVASEARAVGRDRGGGAGDGDLGAHDSQGDRGAGVRRAVGCWSGAAARRWASAVTDIDPTLLGDLQRLV